MPWALQEGTPAAETWQLTWQPDSSSAAGSFAASGLLSALHVNPVGMLPLRQRLVPDLAVPLTVALSAGGARLALCLGAGDDVSADVSDARMLESAVTLHLQDVQVAGLQCLSIFPAWVLSASQFGQISPHVASQLPALLALNSSSKPPSRLLSRQLLPLWGA